MDNILREYAVKCFLNTATKRLTEYKGEYLNPSGVWLPLRSESGIARVFIGNEVPSDTIGMTKVSNLVLNSVYVNSRTDILFAPRACPGMVVTQAMGTGRKAFDALLNFTTTVLLHPKAKLQDRGDALESVIEDFFFFAATCAVMVNKADTSFEAEHL